MNHFQGDEVCKSRVMYIRDIVRGLGRPRWSFPSAIQRELYEDTLRHLVLAISDKRKEDAPIGGTTPSYQMEICGQKRTRKDVLKEIHSLLLHLQRERLYDPPADYEIGYYLLIKRYIRSIMTFFVSGPEIQLVHVGHDDEKFDCYTQLHPMHHMMELSELNKHLADLSVFVSEADVRNGSSITPIMGINEKIELPSSITGSKDRSNAFYLDKFYLAQLDLRSTEFAHCPPLEEEKILYLQSVDNLALSFAVAVDEVNVFSDLLCCLFIERIEREVKDLHRHCKRIKDLILSKLSLTEKYESILEQFNLEIKDHYDEYNPEEFDLTDFKRKLAQSCEISAKELPDYVKCVGKYQRVAVNVAVFIISRLAGHYDTCDCVSHLLMKSWYSEGEAGWRLLHALTLLKHGRFLFGTVLQDHSISQILKKRGRVEFEQEDKWSQKFGFQKEKNDNLKLLGRIIEDVTYCGGLDVKIDKEEEQLLHKIWQNVASSIQFFISAIAYEQRHYIVKKGGLHNDRIPGLRTTRRKKRITIQDVQHKLPDLADEASNLSFVLAALRDGLLEKVGRDAA